MRGESAALWEGRGRSAGSEVSSLQCALQGSGGRKGPGCCFWLQDGYKARAGRLTRMQPPFPACGHSDPGSGGRALHGMPAWSVPELANSSRSAGGFSRGAAHLSLSDKCVVWGKCGRWHKEGYGQRAVVSSVSHPPSVISVSVCMTHIPDPPFYLKMSFKIR